jgi:uracil-DNA glycosylase
VYPVTIPAYESQAVLEAFVPSCQRCPRLLAHCQAQAASPPARHRGAGYYAKPVPGWGDPAARLLIVGLAPAAHGANRTGRMFTGDVERERGGRQWLYEALHAHGFASGPWSEHPEDGLALLGTYLTAAAHCAPPGNKPTPEELRHCLPYLAQTLALIPWRTVLCLGGIATAQTARALGIAPVPFTHGGAHALPDGRTLLTAYHPSRQNTNTGRLTWAMWEGVFARAREVLGVSSGSPSLPTPPLPLATQTREATGL